MLTLEFTSQFKRDLKLSKKRRKDIKKLDKIVQTLLKGEPLHARHRNHTLAGEYKDHNECHIEPDWLLIYLKHKTKLVLVRTGTHADLF